MSEYKEYGVGIYPDSLDQMFDDLEEAQDACSESFFHGLDCYIYGIDKWGDRTYIEKRLVTDNALYVTDNKGNVSSTPVKEAEFSYEDHAKQLVQAYGREGTAVLIEAMEKYANN